MTKKNQIMVLGSYHLTQMDKFTPQMLDEIVSKLDAHHFDVICIEKMSGELLNDIQSRQDSSFNDLLKYFGGNRLELANQAQKSLGIGFLEAQFEISEILKKDVLSEKDHVNLISYFTATTELANALLHFKYLEEPLMLTESDIDNQILEKIKKLSQSPNEAYSLAIKLAKNQNLQQLAYIDNFQDESLHAKHYPMFVNDYVNNQELFKNLMNKPVYKEIDRLAKLAVEQNNLLNLYCYTNSKDYQKQDFETQWQIWLNTNFSSGSDLARYSLWEMRNLQISANIMKTAALNPAKKILVIIGASHKSFIEKYLGQIPNIDILNF